MSNEVTEREPLLTPEQVAHELAVNPLTLANWRSKRLGPRYVKVGKRSVRYRPADVERFLASGSTRAWEELA